MSRSSVVTKYGKLTVDDVNTVLDEISKTVPTMGADGKKKMPSYVHVPLYLVSIVIRTNLSLE